MPDPGTLLRDQESTFPHRSRVIRWLVAPLLLHGCSLLFEPAKATDDGDPPGETSCDCTEIFGEPSLCVELEAVGGDCEGVCSSRSESCRESGVGKICGKGVTSFGGECSASGAETVCVCDADGPGTPDAGRQDAATITTCSTAFPEQVVCIVGERECSVLNEGGGNCTDFCAS